MRKLDCLQKCLEGVFYKYGKLVARHPLSFIIGPLLGTFLLSLGLMRIYMIEDAEELYTPSNGPAKEERKIIQGRFPENDSHSFIPTRRTTLDGSLQIILTKQKGGNVYTKEGIDVALAIDALVRNITINDAGNSYLYSELCAAWEGKCIDNTLLLLLNGRADNIDVINLTYPFHVQSGFSYFIGNQLGGVAFKSENVVNTTEALYLAYIVKYQSEKDKILADAFLRKSIKELDKFQHNSIDVHYQTSLSLDDEMMEATMEITVLFSITYIIITLFATISCSMLDPVRSKAWVAVGGEIAAILAIISSFGLLSAVGVPFTSIVRVVPFLIMGIGMDDMFVIVSSWRHTSYTWSVEERMGKTFETAAISITVTSITDALAFGIGAVTEFKAVTYFCAYAGVAVLFSYIYAITFCAACLAYSGKLEHQNRHNTCCVKVTTKAEAEKKSKSACFKAICTGGDEIHTRTQQSKESNRLSLSKSRHHLEICGIDDEEVVENRSDLNKNELCLTKSKHHFKSKRSNRNSSPEDLHFSTPYVTELIRDNIAPFILHPLTKFVILLIYILYLSFSLWGCLSLQEGLDVKNLAPDDSYVIDFYQNYDKYFYSQYGPKVMIVFTDTLNYHNTSVQYDIQDQLKLFQKNKYFENEDTLTESWLYEYNNFLNRSGQILTNMSSFITVLQNQFLKKQPYDRFVVDISFNENFSEITASRFILQAKGILTSLDERDLMLDARHIAEESSYNITVFSAGFPFFDQYVVIAQNTIQNLGIAVICAMLVSSALLPSLTGIIFVIISVISIGMGVVGFMAIWNVNLDCISMINLIMCIGFSVDFSAHISYHFSISSRTRGDDKAIEALSYMGWPIIQAALSTILGVVVLSLSKTYISRTFFKLMFLVMTFGFCHAFFLLPVILSLIFSLKTCMCRNRDDYIR